MYTYCIRCVTRGYSPRKYIDRKRFPLAFQNLHPDPSHIMIFVMEDMPHMVKKLVNALKMLRSPDSKRNLRLCLNEDYDSPRVHIGLDGLYKT